VLLVFQRKKKTQRKDRSYLLRDICIVVRFETRDARKAATLYLPVWSATSSTEWNVFTFDIQFRYSTIIRRRIAQSKQVASKFLAHVWDSSPFFSLLPVRKTGNASNCRTSWLRAIPQVEYLNSEYVCPVPTLVKFYLVNWREI